MKTLIANFKSNKTKAEMQDWINRFFSFPEAPVEVILCPSSIHLGLFPEHRTARQLVGVQDVSPYPAGAYTGAIAAGNLAGYGVTHAIIGHSERRKHFGETNLEIARKIHESLEAEIIPILCVTKDEIVSQAEAIPLSERERLLVAYEPIESIGTGHTDSLASIVETLQRIRDVFRPQKTIYGGSVSPTTTSEILKNESIDGFLVGSAALDVDKFRSLCDGVS